MAAALSVPVGETVVEIIRLRLLDDVPVMVERTAFTLEAGRHLFDFDTDSGSIFAHLKGNGVELVAARHTFDAVTAAGLDAELLEVPDCTPLRANSGSPRPVPASPSSTPMTGTCPAR